MAEARGAVMLLEVRVDGAGRDEESIRDVTARAKMLLESPDPSRAWTPAVASGVSGKLRFTNAGDALPFLHRFRTELCADPAKPRVKVGAGLGLGDEVDGGRMALEAFRGLGRRGRMLTRALTPEPDANIVLAALCRTVDALHTGWTRAQWQAIHRRDGGKTLQEIGNDLGIAYQNVSKRLIAAQYSLYREVLAAAGLVFSKAGPPGV
jgi:hypothetical protein